MIDYTVSKEPPAIMGELEKKFGVSWDQGVVITYGKTVHCKYDLTPDLLAHEEVHVIQQEKMGAKEWWDEYFTNSKFRLIEETAAYIVQAKYIKEHTPVRQERRSKIRFLVKCMVKMYGGMCTEEEAKAILA